MDIVIPLKRAMINEELRYTLRSICKNVPHNQVWLAGYKPTWLHGPIGFVAVPVPLGDKYIKAATNILTACRDERITPDFLLFNDDFFVMQPITDFQNQHRGPLIDHLRQLEESGDLSSYYKGMKLTYDILRHEGFDDPLNYGLHIPMIINKKKWLEMWEWQLKHNPDKKPVHLRTLYGNLFNIGGEQVADVKIADYAKDPDGSEHFLSSNDNSFAIGGIGHYVRSKFPDICKYESAEPNMFVLK